MKSTQLSLLGAMFTCSSLLAAPIHQGLVSYYPLNGLSPDALEAPDIVSGNNLALVGLGAEAVVPGKFGNALAFDRSFQQNAVYLKAIENGIPISGSQANTIAFWVKALGDGQNDLRVYAEGSTGSNNPLFAFGTGNSADAAIQRTGRIFIRDLSNTVRVDARTTRQVFDDTWHHIAFVDNAGVFSVYVDGTLELTRTYTKTVAPDETVSIGAIQRAGVSNWFTGAIDELALWNRALSAEEVQSLVAGALETPVPKSAPFVTVQPVAPADILPGDPITLKGGVGGSPVLSLQWYKGATLLETTGSTHSIPSAQIADNGTYLFVASSPFGSITSAPVNIAVGSFAAPNLTNGMIAYWPLDEVQGTKTPDLSSGYDMDLVNLTDADLVTGKWGRAFRFDAARQTLLRRIHTAGDLLPMYQHPDFSVALWVRGLPQPDRRVFSEGSTLNTQQLFNLGTHNNGVDPAADSFIRTDTGATGNHRYSTAPAFDDTWHHIVYTQRAAGGTIIAALYVDGVLDPIVLNPLRPLTVNNTTIGGIMRASASAWFTGEVDDVAIWNRSLSPDEAALLTTAVTPTPPSRLQPLAITTFRSGLPAVASGDSTTLSWDLSKDATVVSIDNGIGAVTDSTIAGAGSIAVSPTATTTYTITASRGADSITAQATVTVIDQVAAGWTLLDNFDRYPTGFLSQSPWWADLRGDFARVEELNGNHVMSIRSADSAAVLPLNNLSLQEGQERTVFFRMIPRGAPTAALQHIIGLTDKNARWYADLQGNVGPAVRPLFETELWWLGTINGIGGVIEYAAENLSVDQVYNVWLDIRNTALTDPLDPSDSFSVHIQREGGGPRTTVFSGYVSDRDPNAVDPIIGGVAPVLHSLYIAGNNTADSALFDDFYISRSGYNTTVPRAFGFTVPVGGSAPTMAVATVGNEIEITWDGGALESSLNPTSGWSPVPAATSPHRVTATGDQLFFRARR